MNENNREMEGNAERKLTIKKGNAIISIHEIQNFARRNSGGKKYE